MDAVTEAVRAMYTAFPYPAGGPVLRQGTDARLLLSYAARSRPAGRAVRVLDAGCGRGVGLVAAASVQPDVDFVGIDLCSRSLAEARAEVDRRGLNNVELAEVDLMTLDGLRVPEGGFDVVLSSGVVHHLADPAVGLARLAAVLAPHGVLSLMVYGRHGRESLYRLVRAIDTLIPRDAPLEERLSLGRELAKIAQAPALAVGPWSDQASIHDVEFVDRYLNVHETSYDVPGLFALAERAGLSFLRWTEPAEWDPASVLPPGPLLERARALAPRERAALVDQLTWRPALEAVFVHPTNSARAPLDGRNWAREALAWNPEATLLVERRNLRGSQRTESVRLQVRRRDPLALPQAEAQVALLVEHQQEPFLFGDLVALAAERSIPTKLAQQATLTLLAREALYRPQPADL